MLYIDALAPESPQELAELVSFIIEESEQESPPQELLRARLRLAEKNIAQSHLAENMTLDEVMRHSDLKYALDAYRESKMKETLADA